MSWFTGGKAKPKTKTQQTGWMTGQAISPTPPAAPIAKVTPKWTPPTLQTGEGIGPGLPGEMLQLSAEDMQALVTTAHGYGNTAEGQREYSASPDRVNNPYDSTGSIRSATLGNTAARDFLATNFPALEDLNNTRARKQRQGAMLKVAAIMAPAIGGIVGAGANLAGTGAAIAPAAQAPAAAYGAAAGGGAAGFGGNAAPLLSSGASLSNGIGVAAGQTASPAFTNTAMTSTGADAAATGSSAGIGDLAPQGTGFGGESAGLGLTPSNAAGINTGQGLTAPMSGGKIGSAMSGSTGLTGAAPFSANPALTSAAAPSGFAPTPPPMAAPPPMAGPSPMADFESIIPETSTQAPSTNGIGFDAGSVNVPTGGEGFSLSNAGQGLTTPSAGGAIGGGIDAGANFLSDPALTNNIPTASPGTPTTPYESLLPENPVTQSPSNPLTSPDVGYNSPQDPTTVDIKGGGDGTGGTGGFGEAGVDLGAYPGLEGATVAKEGIFGGALSKIGELGKKYGPVVFAGVEYANAKEASSAYEQQLNEIISSSDPFSGERAHYQRLLQQHLDNPDAFLNSPQIKFATQAAARKMSSMGYNMSPAQAQAVADASIGQYYNHANMLGGLAGSDISPNMGAVGDAYSRTVGAGYNQYATGANFVREILGRMNTGGYSGDTEGAKAAPEEEDGQPKKYLA